jgi:small conductance mechanosensitive channel
MEQWQNTILDSVIRYGFQLVGAVIILVIGALIARWVGQFVGKWLDKYRLEPPVKLLFVRVVRLIVIALAVVLALDKFGAQIAPLIAGIGVVGVGISLAAQGVLGNVVAGLTIIFTKPFRVGECIELLGVYGQVQSIELFSTTLIHPDQSRVVIPNRKIVGEILHNYGTIRQLDLNVGIAYSSDVNRALSTVHEILNSNSRVLKDPKPVVGIEALADSSVTLGVSPWVSVPDYVVAQLEIYQAIIEQFRARGIEIPFPQRDVHLANQKAA